MFVDAGSSSGQTPAPVEEAASADSELGLGELERQIGELAGHIAAATCRWLTLIAEFDRRNGHETAGFVSCATWLAWRCSIAPRAAQEHLRVARSLNELPKIRAAFGAGALSYSKVRALTRVAEPEMEEELLEMALEATAAQLERLMRGYRGALTEDATSRGFERRHLRTQWDDDGSLRISGSLPAEEGALLLKALELAQDELSAERQANESAAEDEVDRGGESSGAVPRPTAADALMALAESGVARGVSEAAGGDRHQIVVHVDVDQLVTPSGGGGYGGELVSGARLPAEAMRRIGCDASIVSLAERDGHPLSVGRKTRTVPPSVARALRSRDGGCQFPGCTRDRFVDAHHIEHWARGGKTELDNLVQLCRHHHRLVHEGGFSVERHGAGLVFRRPSGGLIRAHPRRSRGSIRGCIAVAAEAGAKIDASTCEPRSRGSWMDADLAVFALASLQERRCNESARRAPERDTPIAARAP